MHLNWAFTDLKTPFSWLFHSFLQIVPSTMSPHQPPRPSLFRSDFGLSFGASLRCSLKDLPLTSKSGLCVLPQYTILSHHTLSHPVAVIVCWYLPLKCASRNPCLSGLTVYPQDLEQCLAHIRISINMYWMTNWRHTPCLKEAFNLVVKTDTHSAREWGSVEHKVRIELASFNIPNQSIMVNAMAYAIALD